MDPLRCSPQFDPFFSLDCARRRDQILPSGNPGVRTPLYLDVGLPVTRLEVEVEGESLGALELCQPDVAGRPGLVAPHHLSAVALSRHPKVLRVRPERERERVSFKTIL